MSGNRARTLFIVNPAAGAGRGLERWNALARELANTRGEFEHLVTTGPGEAMALAQSRAPAFELIIAVGGDGTALEVASGILASSHPQCALGAVPVGTGNDIATALGIVRPVDVAPLLARGVFSAVDAIRVECHIAGRPAVRHALLFAGVGIVGECLKRTTPSVKRILGERLAYPFGLLRALRSYPSPLMRIAHDAGTEQGRFLFACASNSECAGGGMRLAPGARMDDSELNLTLVGALGWWRALFQVRRVCHGRHLGHPSVRYFTGRKLTIESQPPLEVAADGELLGETPATFQISPSALRVLTLDGLKGPERGRRRPVSG